MSTLLIGSMALAATLSAAQDLSDPTRPLGSADNKNAATAMKGKTPRLATGKPDLSGVWSPDRNFIYDLSDALKPGEELPLQPWAQKLARERMSKDDPEANCLPTGVPRLAPYPWNIVQTAKHTYFLFEGNIHSYRQIFMDGRKHSEDPNPTWYGESIGHWDSDTLVIDTIGFNELFWFDFAGHPHTAKLHVTEKYRRPDMGHLEWESIIDDPGAYTQPFTLYGHSALQNTDLMEYICQENNKDVTHILGKDQRNRDAKRAAEGNK
jgi:hypothetical protein